VLLWVSPRPGYAEGIQTVFPAIVATVLVVAMLFGDRRAARAEAVSA
jgi:hypothetical protein